MTNEQLTIPDNELILLAKTGNDAALETLIRRHLPAVFRLCSSILKDPDQAQDAVQETMIKVWRNLKKINPEKNFRAWSMEIAKNTCLDAVKKKSSIPLSAFEDEEGNNALAESLASTIPSPAENADHSLLKKLLDGATAKLSPAYRLVLGLYYQQGLNFREISEQLNEPLHTIKSRHRRAIINLRLILSQNS